MVRLLPVISALERLRLRHHWEFEANMGYVVYSRQDPAVSETPNK